MAKLPQLIPMPRMLSLASGACSLRDHRLIVLNCPDPQALLFSAHRLQASLRERAGLSWEIAASPAGPSDDIGVTLSVVPGSVRHPQGYELTITPAGIHAVAGTAAGVFYAVCTLIQLLESSFQLPVSSFELPALRISDWPDFPARGVMLDVSRDRVPTMATLYDLVDLLASWKVNQLQLYTEHTFAYRNHPEVWAEASPITGEEILALDAYCRERFVELVPNQNSFGHMAPWLEAATLPTPGGDDRRLDRTLGRNVSRRLQPVPGRPRQPGSGARTVRRVAAAFLEPDVQRRLRRDL